MKKSIVNYSALNVHNLKVLENVICLNCPKGSFENYHLVLQIVTLGSN